MGAHSRGFEACWVDSRQIIVMHPNQVKYPGQMISVVQSDDDVYLVPFVETESGIFLKTIIPSRKATREFGSKK